MQLCGTCRGGGVVPGNSHISFPTQDMDTGSREKATRLEPRQDVGVGGETRGGRSEQPARRHLLLLSRQGLGFFPQVQKSHQ